MPAFVHYLLCFIAGGVASLAFAPYNISALIFVSLGTLFFYVLENRKKNTCFLYGYYYGLGFFGFGIYWLYISINLFGGVNLIGAYFVTALFIALHALYPAFMCYLLTKYFKNSSDAALIFSMAALWALIEWCRTWFLTGFPWLAVGYTQTETFLSSYAPVVGVYGLSFFVLLIASSISLILHSRFKHLSLGFFNIILILSVAYGLNHVHWTEQQTETWDVALLQAGIKQEDKWKESFREKTIDLYQSLSVEHWGKDLILWPETALPFFYHQGIDVVDDLSKQAQQTQTELLVGIPYADPETRQYYNSIISIGPSAGLYLKKHLVPFGEYLPLDNYIRPILNALNIPMSNFSAGDQEKPLIKLKEHYVGMSICYEDVFGEEFIHALPEANILVNVSNDAWFGDSAAPHQHLQMAQMRAIEMSRYLLRATNNGVTAIIDNKGKILKQSPQFVADSIEANVLLFKGSTPYSVIGNYGILVLIVFIFSLNLIFLKRKS